MLFPSFFQNKEGKFVIWQFPNFPLLAGLVCSLVARVTHSSGFKYLSMAFFFTWAYLELRYGESMFRRILGGTVLAVVTTTYLGST